jgi:putative membrane protein
MCALRDRIAPCFCRPTAASFRCVKTETRTVPPRLKKFIQVWIANTLAVLVAVLILRGRIRYETPLDLFIASLLLGILNAFLRPIMLLLALPLLIFTLGLFMLVINALLLYFVAWLLPGFEVRGFWSAFWGALIISVVSMAVNVLTGNTKARVQVSRKPPPQDSDQGGSGPVIDI